VTPGRGAEGATLRPSSLLISALLPTLGKPTCAATTRTSDLVLAFVVSDREVSRLLKSSHGQEILHRLETSSHMHVSRIADAGMMLELSQAHSRVLPSSGNCCWHDQEGI